MDADHANRDSARIKIAELWHPLPWWERVVYVLTVLLFLLAFLVDVLTKSVFGNVSMRLADWALYADRWGADSLLTHARCERDCSSAQRALRRQRNQRASQEAW